MSLDFVTTAFVQQFRDTIIMLSQQSVSRFRDTCMEDTIIGESGFVEQLGPQDMIEATSRHGDTPLFNMEHLRRVVRPIDADWGALIDKLDKVKMLINADSAYTQAAAKAVARRYDTVFVNALFATAYGGKAGTTSYAWPTGPGGDIPAGTVVAVNSNKYGNTTGNTGLTISKLIEARVALLSNEALDGSSTDGQGSGSEDLYFTCSAKQIGNLLATTEATAKDFGTSKEEIGALVSGKINTLVGFKFRRYEKLPTTAGTNYRRCAAWAKGAMAIGVGQDMDVRIDPRPDKRYATQVYASVSVGATRIEEAKLVEVQCLEA